MRLTKEETLKLLTLIQASYENFFPKNHETQKMFIETWHDALSDLSLDDALGALKQHMRESVYVPKVADIYQRAIAKRLPTFNDPVEEFNKVIKACGKYGSNRSDEAMKTFSDYTKKVVEMMGGFRKFCMASVDDELSDRKHFTETYNRLIDRETKAIKEGRTLPIQLNSPIQNKQIDAKINDALKGKLING